MSEYHKMLFLVVVAAGLVASVECVAQVLEMNDKVSVVLSQPGSFSDLEAVFRVEVPGDANDPRAHVKMDDWLDSTSLYTKQGSIPTTSDYDYRDSTGKTIQTFSGFNNIFEAKMGKGATWYIMVRGNDNLELTAKSDLFTTLEIVLMVLGGLALLVIIGLILAKFTCYKNKEEPDMLILTAWGQFFCNLFIVCLTPMILLIVGLSLSTTAPMMTGIFGIISGVLLVCFFFFAGPRTYIMDEKKKEMTVIRRFMLFLRRSTVYKFDDVEGFFFRVGHTKKGSTTYQMKMRTKSHGEISMEMGSSNVRIESRRQFMKKLANFINSNSEGRASPCTAEADPISGILSTLATAHARVQLGMVGAPAGTFGFCSNAACRKPFPDATTRFCGTCGTPKVIAPTGIPPAAAAPTAPAAPPYGYGYGYGGSNNVPGAGMGYGSSAPPPTAPPATMGATAPYYPAASAPTYPSSSKTTTTYNPGL